MLVDEADRAKPAKSNELCLDGRRIRKHREVMLKYLIVLRCNKRQKMVGQIFESPHLPKGVKCEWTN